MTEGLKHAVLRYRLKPDALAEHERLQRPVFEELARVRPPGLRWASYRLADGVCVEVVAFESGGTLSALESWSAYRSGLDARCDEVLVFEDAALAAAYDGAAQPAT